MNSYEISHLVKYVRIGNHLMRSTPSSNPPFGEIVFSLFKSHISSERHLFLIKLKEIIKKLKIKYRVGVGRALLSVLTLLYIRWHPFNSLI